LILWAFRVSQLHCPSDNNGSKSNGALQLCQKGEGSVSWLLEKTL